MQAELGGKLAFEPRDVPLLFHAVGRYVQIDQVADDFFADTFSQVADVFAVEDFVALVVDDFTLVVGNVVVFQYLFAHVEVAAFDFALRAFDLAGQHAMFDGDTAFRRKAVEDGGGTVEREEAQQRVFKREVEAARAWVALTACASRAIGCRYGGFRGVRYR